MEQGVKCSWHGGADPWVGRGGPGGQNHPPPSGGPHNFKKREKCARIQLVLAEVKGKGPGNCE